MSFTDVKLTGKFWRERLDTVLAKTVPNQYDMLVKHNIVESLQVRQPPLPLTIPHNCHGFTTQIFWDSDVGKWIEAASYAQAHGPDAEIEGRIDGQGATLGWLFELLVHRPRDRQALDKPARQS